MKKIETVIKVYPKEKGFEQSKPRLDLQKFLEEYQLVNPVELDRVKGIEFKGGWYKYTIEIDKDTCAYLVLPKEYINSNEE